MNEILFIVEEAPEGGLTARALGESIFTEADNVESLHQQVRDAVHCHFIEGEVRHDSPGLPQPAEMTGHSLIQIRT